MLVLGIDPGYGIVGFGLVYSEGMSMQALQYGAIRTEPGTEFAQRLYQIHEDMLTLIDQFHPDAMSVEELFFNTNLTTGIQVAHARGVILLAAKERGIPVFEYTPSQVKQSIVGYGRAEKRQVMEMTKSFLHLDRIPKPDDAADALALAICHIHSSGGILGQKRTFR